MFNHSDQTCMPYQPNQTAGQRQNLFIRADSICCAYCGVVILPAERRAHTANYFARWGYLHDACERALRRAELSTDEINR